MTLLAAGAAALAGIGAVLALIASGLVRSAVRSWKLARSASASGTGALPGVTVLKPLYGTEPLLAEALETLFQQDYPEWQMVFGVQNPADPAVDVVRRLHARYPDRDAVLVVDPAIHGPNRKVGNLINMASSARHDVLVIADSDVHALPNYLKRLVTASEKPGVGLVTVLYAGLPLGRGAVQALGATQITHGFLPGAVLSRALGRQDCLGATMCLHRRDLERIGGFQALVEHLADDNVLGRRIREFGLQIALADTVVLTTVPETTLRALFRHELRWARTIRALEPAGFAASLLQYPLAWALLAVALAGGAAWSVGVFMLAWLARGIAGYGVDAALGPEWAGSDKAGLAFRCPVWLLPFRDILSVAVAFASYAGTRVDWRGHALHADKPTRSSHSIEEASSR